MKCQSLFSGKNKKKINIINLSEFRWFWHFILKYVLTFHWFWMSSAWTDFDISCQETVCTKWHILFLGKMRKISLSFDEVACRVVKVNIRVTSYYLRFDWFMKHFLLYELAQLPQFKSVLSVKWIFCNCSCPHSTRHTTLKQHCFKSFPFRVDPF